LQGVPQKEAARSLGWKIGSVTSNLSRAKERLMKALESRGLPLAILAGIPAASSALIPQTLFKKATAVAVPSAAIPKSIHLLAKGTTTMYLRTKIAGLGILAASLLTVGIGLLPVADAQNKEIEAQIKEQLDFKRDALEKAKVGSKWEYRFELITKAPMMTDFEAKLHTMERDRWEYCGVQEMVEGRHMVFKRLSKEAIPAVANAVSDERIKVLLEHLLRKDQHNALTSENAQVKTAQIHGLKKQLELMKQQLDIAFDQADQTKQAHKQGMASTIDVREKESAITKTKIEMVKVEKDIEVAVAELKAIDDRAKQFSAQDHLLLEANAERTTIEKAKAQEALLKAERAKKAEEEAKKKASDNADLEQKRKLLESQIADLEKRLSVLKNADKKPSNNTEAALKVKTFNLKNIKSSVIIKTLEKVYGNQKNLKLTIDDRTNSLIVSSTDEAIFKDIAELIEILDKQ
jgi:hypothetical protein